MRATPLPQDDSVESWDGVTELALRWIERHAQAGFQIQLPGWEPKMTPNLLGGNLLPRQAQLEHHPFLAFVIDHEVAMQENVTVFLKMRARDGLAPRMLGIGNRGARRILSSKQFL